MVGDKIKVRIPGETPWAIVTAELRDGRVLARIDNETVSGLHGYQYGDVATFEPDHDDQRVKWILSSQERQTPNGPQRLEPSLPAAKAK